MVLVLDHGSQVTSVTWPWLDHGLAMASGVGLGNPETHGTGNPATPGSSATDHAQVMVLSRRAGRGGGASGT